MKKVKYILSLFMLLLVIFLNSEMYQKELDTFMTRNYLIINEYVSGEDRSGFYEHLLMSAEGCNAGVYSVYGRQNSIDEREIRIYASDNARKTLEENSVLEGSYSSLISGKINVKYEEFQLSDDNIYNEKFYITGTEEEAENVTRLLKMYEGKFNLKKESGYISETLQCLIWAGIFGFMVMLTCFDAGYQKKEISIRASLGGSIWSSFWENVIKDIVFYTAALAVIMYVLREYICFEFRIKEFIIGFIIFLIVNSIVYITFFKVDFKKALSGQSIDEGIRGNLYIVKIFTIITAIIMASANIYTIIDCVEFKKQEKTINIFEDYSYIKEQFNVGKRYNEDTDEYMNRQAAILYNAYRSDSVALNTPIWHDDTDRRYIVVNDNAKKVLEEFSEMKNLNYDLGVHVLIPEEWWKDRDYIGEQASHSLALSLYSGFENEKYEVIKYSGTKKVLNVHEDYEGKTGYAVNPIIVYITVDNDFFPEKVSELENVTSIIDYTMFRFDASHITELEKEYNLRSKHIYIYSENVKECYDYYKGSINRRLLVNSWISILLMTLEASVVFSVLKMEYSVNSLELAIKKTLGYGMLSKNKALIILMLVSDCIGIAITEILALMYKVTDWYAGLIVGVMLGIIEILIIFLFANRLERANTIKILKGVNL